MQLNLAMQQKKVTIFGTFLVGGRGGDIRYCLEMTYFWFVMILCIMIYVGWAYLIARRNPSNVDVSLFMLLRPLRSP